MTGLFLSILETSASVSLIVIGLLLLKPWLNKRYAAKWNYLIWIFLALRLLAPLGEAGGAHMMDLLSQPGAHTAPEAEETVAGSPDGAAQAPGRIIFEIPSQMTAPLTGQSGKKDATVTALDLMIFIWKLGVLLFLSVHFLSYFHYLRQIKKEGSKIKEASILRQLSALKRELHIRRSIKVVEYPHAGSPMIIGFCKPVLILPGKQYRTEELFFILKHELIHLKRGDLYWKLLFVTANAVHWPNPLIWVMQKEAAVDMEMACDEQVTKGMDFKIRKAYTETLLSMLHQRCSKKTALSTQFYGGTKIMKMRFQNILRKKRGKNGISLLIGTVVFTICLGTLVGCSVSGPDTKSMPAETEKEEVQAEPAPAEPTPAAPSSAESEGSENTTTLIFTKEGEPEEKQATLAAGDGYFIFLPDGEWQQSDTDTWTATANDQVLLRIEHYADQTIESADQKLMDDGYVISEDGQRQKQEEDQICHVQWKDFGNDLWGVFYCYPADAEEGWGRELPVIADTFALSLTDR